jgi:hypothetical protein
MSTKRLCIFTKDNRIWSYLRFNELLFVRRTLVTLWLALPYTHTQLHQLQHTLSPIPADVHKKPDNDNLLLFSEENYFCSLALVYIMTPEKGSMIALILSRLSL